MPRTEQNLTMLDIRDPSGVEIETSLQGTILWINIDGVCRLRVQDIEEGTLIIGQNLRDLIAEER